MFGIFGNLTPCFPLSLSRRGGFIMEEGLMPLLNTPTFLTRSKERRSLSYISISPFPLTKGRGIKGDGVAK